MSGVQGVHIRREDHGPGPVDGRRTQQPSPSPLEPGWWAVSGYVGLVWCRKQGLKVWKVWKGTVGCGKYLEVQVQVPYWGTLRSREGCHCWTALAKVQCDEVTGARCRDSGRGATASLIAFLKRQMTTLSDMSGDGCCLLCVKTWSRRPQPRRFDAEIKKHGLSWRRDNRETWETWSLARGT